MALAGPGEPSIGNAFNVVEALNNHQQAQDGPIVRLAVQEGLEPRLGGKLLARPLLASLWRNPAALPMYDGPLIRLLGAPSRFVQAHQTASRPPFNPT